MNDLFSSGRRPAPYAFTVPAVSAFTIATRTFTTVGMPRSLRGTAHIAGTVIAVPVALTPAKNNRSA